MEGGLGLSHSTNSDQMLPIAINGVNRTANRKVLHLYHRIMQDLIGCNKESCRFTVCTEIAIILGTVRFMIRGSHLRYKRYHAHFLKKSSVELPFSSFGDHLINILRKVN
jgi:hypothetical protein